MFGQNCRTILPVAGASKCAMSLELDSPGEWFLSHATNTLYFYPPSGGAPSNGSVVWATHRLFIVKRHLTSTLSASLSATLRPTNRRHGLSADGPVELDYASNCTLQSCKIPDVAGNGVLLGESSNHITIKDCEISGTEEPEC